MQATDERKKETRTDGKIRTSGKTVPPEKVLRARNIAKAFEGADGVTLPVLENVSADFAPGITGIAGPSGLGKTTFLKILAGVTKPDAGEIIRGTGPIGFVFQENRLLPWKTVGENLRFVQKKPDEAAIDRTLAMCRLLENKQQYPEELSGGMNRRAALARALVNRPDYLFLDEPFTGLDEALIEELTADIRTIVREEGMIAVAVSHQTDALAALSDTVIRLENLERGGGDEQRDASVRPD